MLHKVLVTARSFVRYPGRHTALLEQTGWSVHVDHRPNALTEAEVRELVGDVDAIIAGGDTYSRAVFAAAPRLKVVSRHGVGCDAIDLRAATEAGVAVTITPGSNSVSVAELALGLMISLARHIPAMVNATRGGKWEQRQGMELAGKTVGIVGLGRIGTALAARARALEMIVLAHDVREAQTISQQYAIRYVPLIDLLSFSDFVVLTASTTAGARPLIGEEQLLRMKPDAYFVNVARGSLVDEHALYRALVENRIAGAALDVLSQEPPGRNPLLTLDSVLPTPHIGGVTREANERGSIMAIENVAQVLRGEMCPNTVNPEVYAQWRRGT